MYEKEHCGWFIKRNPERPCVLRAQHPGFHRDAEYLKRQREYDKVNKERIAKRKREYYEVNKEQRAKYLREYREANKEQIAEHKREYYEANKERIIERNLEYTQTPKGKEVSKRREHKRRARKRSAVTGPLPADITTYLLSLYGADCQQCHCKLTLQATHIDHVIPLAQGGMHTLWNLQPLCSSCNLSKQDKVPADEIELLQLFNKAVGFAPERVMIPWGRKVKG